MKHKRIWFKGRIGKEVWQDKIKERSTLITLELTKITVTRQNMESLYISQTEKQYKYYDVK